MELERGKGGLVELLEDWRAEEHWIGYEEVRLSSIAATMAGFALCTHDNASCSPVRRHGGIDVEDFE